jgi:hypothetical protein
MKRERPLLGSGAVGGLVIGWIVGMPTSPL